MLAEATLLERGYLYQFTASWIIPFHFAVVDRVPHWFHGRTH
jgi:hypothetical protein